MTDQVIEMICSEGRGLERSTLMEVVRLAVEIAREGREGRKIGTLFTVGDCEHVLRCSRCLILDPLRGHPEDQKNLNDPNLRETVKELAQLDGAFVVSAGGVVISACRYLNATAEGIQLPMGLGARHMAAASISLHTRALAVVVSETSVVRLFDRGDLVAEIAPETWRVPERVTPLRGAEPRSGGPGPPAGGSRPE